MDTQAPSFALSWEFWTAAGTVGGTMLLLCGFIGRLIWKMSRFVEESRASRINNDRAHAYMGTQIEQVNQRVNRHNHRIVQLAVAGAAGMTACAFPSGDQRKEFANIADDYKKVLDDQDAT